MYDLHCYHHFFRLLQLALTPAVQSTATWDMVLGNSSSCSVPALCSSSSEQITSGDGLLGWGLVLVHGGKKAAERCMVRSVLHPGALFSEFGSRLSPYCELEMVLVPPLLSQADSLYPSPPTPLFFFPVVKLCIGKDLWICYVNFPFLAKAFLTSPYSLPSSPRVDGVLCIFWGVICNKLIGNEWKMFSLVGQITLGFVNSAVVD